MDNRYIYVWSEEQIDRSRWLSLRLSEDGRLTVPLNDLCHPGKVSGLSQVSMPVELFQSALRNGALQVTTGTGYCLFRQMQDLLSVEFRSLDDIGLSKATVRLEDVSRRITELLSDRMTGAR